MKDFGITRSTIKPLDIEILETKVFVAENIQEISVSSGMDDDTETHTEYEYNLIEYEKDEYILNIDKKNSELEQSLTETQLALCEVYEML